uniref:Uncharacterized protein n=1 Tax=Setaria viridis TaxID=4556 RepID=A0A4U6W6H2_SETVI|nr:hypothetical protein SEVIR_1G072333v2 [Setaria viridis]
MGETGGETTAWVKWPAAALICLSSASADVTRPVKRISAGKQRRALPSRMRATSTT